MFFQASYNLRVSGVSQYISDNRILFLHYLIWDMYRITHCVMLNKYAKSIHKYQNF